MAEINENKISLFEKIEFKQHIVDKFFEKKYMKKPIEIKLEKNNLGTFSIIIKNINFDQKQIFISLNNKINIVSKKINTYKNKEVIIDSETLNNILFKNVSTISVAINIFDNPYPNFPYQEGHLINFRMWKRMSELNVKLIREQKTNKTFYLNDDSSIIETYSSINFSQSYDGVKSSTEKSRVKILLKKLTLGKHNVEMISFQNTPNTPTPFIAGKTIEGLEMNTKKQNVKFTKSHLAQDIETGIFGSVIFDHNTYYSFEDNQTYIGIGENSQKGYIVPYKFKGNLFPKLLLDIDFETDITIGYSNKINQAYFDKFSGKINLNISEIEKKFDDKYANKILISNSNFSNIILENLTLDEIKKLDKNGE